MKLSGGNRDSASVNKEHGVPLTSDKTRQTAFTISSFSRLGCSSGKLSSPNSLAAFFNAAQSTLGQKPLRNSGLTGDSTSSTRVTSRKESGKFEG
jgi:uncharacterized protein (UPF0548 family)